MPARLRRAPASRMKSFGYARGPAFRRLVGLLRMPAVQYCCRRMIIMPGGRYRCAASPLGCFALQRLVFLEVIVGQAELLLLVQYLARHLEELVFFLLEVVVDLVDQLARAR